MAVEEEEEEEVFIPHNKKKKPLCSAKRSKRVDKDRAKDRQTERERGL